MSAISTTLPASQQTHTTSPAATIATASPISSAQEAISYVGDIKEVIRFMAYPMMTDPNLPTVPTPNTPRPVDSHKSCCSCTIQ